MYAFFYILQYNYKHTREINNKSKQDNTLKIKIKTSILYCMFFSKNGNKEKTKIHS